MTVALLLHRADGAPPSTSFRKAAFGTADPFARNRAIAWEGPGAMSAGRVSFIGEVDVANFPHTETIVVVEGTLSLIAVDAAPLVLRRGEGAVIARGTALRIQAAARSLFVFCAAAAELANQPGITRLRADANFSDRTRWPAEVLLGPAPQCRSDNVFKDELTWSSPAPGIRCQDHPHRSRPPPQRVQCRLHAACGLQHLMAACSPPSPAMRCLCPRAHRSAGKSSDRVAKFYVCQSVPA